MRAGYLCLQTNRESPGLVRVLIRDTLPDTRQETLSDPKIRYVARFNDVDAAQMHVQNSLGSRLTDLETRTYRVDLGEAMATVDADILKHRKIWVDPALDSELLKRIDHLTSRKRDRHQRIERIWQIVGNLAAALLVFQLLLTL